MGGRMSRDKGKRGEREIIALLQPVVDQAFKTLRMDSWDLDTRLRRNTLQSDSGGYDIVGPGMDYFAVEVKFQEQLSVETWWKQTQEQTKHGQVPVLFYRKSRLPWRVRTELPVQYPGPWVHWTQVEMTVDNWLPFYSDVLRDRISKDSRFCAS